jgi:hypothetical protein
MEATENNEFPINGTVGLVISLISWGSIIR